MNDPTKTDDQQQAEGRTRAKMEIVINPSAGIFMRALGLGIALLLFAVVFFFSVLVFAILAVATMVLLARMWWNRRRARKE